MSAPAFTEQDVAKALSGAARGGFTVARVDIDRKTGRISLFASGGEAPPAAMTAEDEIAEWLENDRRQSQGAAPRHR